MEKRKQRKRIRPEKMIVIIFCLSICLFCASKIGLKSYNITLQMRQQELAKELEIIQADVNTLKSEVNALQDKSRVLGMLDNQVSDNQNNIYIMD